VTKGWRGLTEINAVWYDDSEITVEEMEDSLMKAGTFRNTFKY
jgi:hypothetical protein